MISEHIESLGFELECGIKTEEGLQKIRRESNGGLSRLEVESDGSVYVPETAYENAEIKYYSDELPEIHETLDWLMKLVETNGTCGFHIHIRLKNIGSNFGILTHKFYYSEFIKAYKTEFRGNSKYEARLTNRYCKPSYRESDIDRQLSTPRKDSSRYKAINFNAYTVHDTIEIRIMPHPDSAAEAKKEIQFVISQIERILTMPASITSTYKPQIDRLLY